jgi:putative transposase
VPEVDGAIGIDWGVTVTATTTDPAYDLPFGGHRRRCAAELAKA